MTSNKAVLPKMPKSGASIYKKVSWADVFSANFLHVILNLVSSINTWQSPLCTGSPVWKLLCSCVRNTAPCACTSWMPWLMGHAHDVPHSCPAVSGDGGVGRAWLNTLTSISACCCSSRGGICCSCLKQRTEQEGKRLAACVWGGSRVSGGCNAPPAFDPYAGVLPQARISFYCER